jgi:hypothetical protein
MPRNIFVSGRMRVLFDLREVAVNIDEPDVKVSSYVCKWCGWTAVVDDPGLIPDHDCHGPSGRPGSG